MLVNVASERSEAVYSFRNLDLTSQKVLSDWLSQCCVPNPIPHEKLHCSVICACNDLPSDYIPDRRRLCLEPHTYGLGIIGPAFALFFQSTPLERQWNDAVEHGVHMKYPNFVPHISLSYSVQTDWDYSLLSPPPFALTLEAEVVASFDPQFAKRNWQNA